jgi:hypothetical protein
MPEKVKPIGSTGHGATIHMSTGRGIMVKKHFLLLELLIHMMRASCIHRTNAKIKSMKGTGGRVQSIGKGSDEVHLGRIRRETSRLQIAKKMKVGRKLVKVLREIIQEGREIVLVKVIIIIREGEAVRSNKTTSFPVAFLILIQLQVCGVKKIRARQYILPRMAIRLNGIDGSIVGSQPANFLVLPRRRRSGGGVKEARQMVAGKLIVHNGLEVGTSRDKMVGGGTQEASAIGSGKSR